MQKRLIQLTDQNRNNFDFIRFCLASFVLVYHSLPVYYGQGHVPQSAIDRLSEFAGRFAVDFFFVISGFLVLNSWEREPHAGRYLQKRVLRIYPAWLALAAVTALVFGPLGAQSHAAYWHAFHPLRFAKNALVLAGPDVPPIFTALPLAGMVNASAWTLRYEFACYLGILVLGLFSLVRFRAALLGIYVVLCLSNLLQATDIHPLAHAHEYPIFGDPVSWLRLAPDFLAGMLAYLYQDRIICSLPAAIVGAAACIVLAVTTAGWAEAAAPLVGAYFVVLVAFTPLPMIGDWAKRGDFSYGIYLYAFPIQQLVLLRFGREPWFSVATLTVISYGVTLLAAVISWHVVERPALLLKGAAFKPQVHPPIVDEPAADT